MPDDPATPPNRRDFLTGKAVIEQVAQAGEALADELLATTDATAHPVAGDTIRLETRAMACTWTVIMNPAPPRQVMVASDALNLVHRLEDQLTVYRDDSELALINQRAFDDPQSVEPQLFKLLQSCRQLADDTGHAFDPTSGPLIDLWRTCRAEGRLPDQTEIDATRLRVGIDRIQFNTANHTIRYGTAGMKVDLGAVGKGYAVDRAAGHLLEEGIDQFLLHGGHSSLTARGSHYGQSGWPVGIRNPLFTEQRYATIMICNQAMATSGSNVQYFRHGGKRYGHILDPRTGWPAEGTLSVTVLAPRAATADALSTAFYVMGVDKARDWCNTHPDIGAIFIPASGDQRSLAPVILNLPPEQLFFAQGV